MAPPVEILSPRDRQPFTTSILPPKPEITTSVQELAPRPHTLVLNPAFITQDIDELRFNAAAQNQLPSSDSTFTTPGSDSDSEDSPSPVYSTLLISSPYNLPGHHLSLTPLSTPSLLFALALTALKPARHDYPTAPYAQALNFPTILSHLRSLLSRTSFLWPKTSFHVVIFRSTLHPGIDQARLAELDLESHREACESGGLLKYWFGKADLNGDRRNLATCFWESEGDAERGGGGPWHQRARREGREMYQEIRFETVRFVVGEGAGEWWIEGDK